MVVDPKKAASIRAAYNHAIGSSELSQHAKNFHNTYRIRYRRGQSSGKFVVHDALHLEAVPDTRCAMIRLKSLIGLRSGAPASPNFNSQGRGWAPHLGKTPTPKHHTK